MDRTSTKGKVSKEAGVRGWAGGGDSSKAQGGDSLGRLDPEVLEKPVRRMFTAPYKLRVIQEADSCREKGQIGALLRREGLYSSHLTTWRRQRNQGMLDGLTPRQRGRKMGVIDERDIRIRELEQEKERLGRKLKKAEVIIDFQKKAFALLEIPLRSGEDQD